MEEQQRNPQLMPERNGRNPHPPVPVYTATFEENKTEEWDLRQILAVARRRVLVMGSVAIAICAGVWFSTLTNKPKYEGKFRVLVEPVTSEHKLSGLSDMPGASENTQQEGMDYSTQIMVLLSPEIMTPIVKQIATRYPDVSYNSVVGNLKLARLQETKILEVTYQDSDPQKVEVVLQQLSKAYLKYSLQQRQANLGQGIQFVNYQLPQLQARVNSLQTELQRFRQQYYFIDPEAKAERVAAQASSIEFQRQDTEKQLAELRAFYATLQGRSGAQLAETPALNGATQSQSDSDMAETPPVDGPSQDKSGGEVAKSRASNSTSQRSGTAAVQNEGSLYQRLVGQLRDVDTQLAAELTRFREGSPTIEALRQKRDNLLPVLKQEAQRTLKNKKVEVANQISLLQVRQAKIKQAENSLNQQVKQLPVLARQYTDLQRELKIATESLNRFLQKRESLQIESAQKQIPWQLLALPQLPQAPIAPNVQRNLILGAIAGLLAGMAAALLAERLDRVFHSPDDLKEVTKLPLLGGIPFHKHLNQPALVSESRSRTNSNNSRRLSHDSIGNQNYSYFPFLEAFRSLNTSISFLGSDTPINSIVISSSVHAEGKSTVALHLAQAAAAMGKRVLLVDADLRLPQVHRLMNIPNEQGLSNIISTNLPISEAIQQSPLWDNLFLLTSGQIPPDPTKLLSSKKMQNIMEQLRQSFDFVIYDTPPLLGLADSSLLAAYTAGLVLVVRIGRTDRAMLKQALERLKLTRAPVLGTVVNGVKSYTQPGYGYYYYRPNNPTGVT